MMVCLEAGAAGQCPGHGAGAISGDDLFIRLKDQTSIIECVYTTYRLIE